MPTKARTQAAACMHATCSDVLTMPTEDSRRARAWLADSAHACCAAGRKRPEARTQEGQEDGQLRPGSPHDRAQRAAEYQRTLQDEAHCAQVARAKGLPRPAPFNPHAGAHLA